MVEKNPSDPSPFGLLRVWSALAAMAVVSCGGSVTLPDTTPVYADELAPGVEPIAVERKSVNRPTAEVVSPKVEPASGDAPEAEAVVPEGQPRAASEGASAPQSSQPAPAAGSAPSANDAKSSSTLPKAGAPAVAPDPSAK